MDDPRLIAAGLEAVRAAAYAWSRPVVEPRVRGEERDSARWIDNIIRTPKGLDWAWLGEHEAFDSYEWCGAFAAHCWGAAGLSLDLRRLYWSSTSRLDAYARYGVHFGTSNEDRVRAAYPRPEDASMRRRRLVLDEDSTPEDVDAWAPRAGDILLVGAAGSRMGTHICLVESWDPEHGIFRTLEGNARGRFPDRDRPGRQGVVRQERKVGLARGESRKMYHARRLIRPSVLDLEGVR